MTRPRAPSGTRGRAGSPGVADRSAGGMLAQPPDPAPPDARARGLTDDRTILTGRQTAGPSLRHFSTLAGIKRDGGAAHVGHGLRFGMQIG